MGSLLAGWTTSSAATLMCKHLSAINLTQGSRQAYDQHSLIVARQTAARVAVSSGATRLVYRCSLYYGLACLYPWTRPYHVPCITTPSPLPSRLNFTTAHHLQVGKCLGLCKVPDKDTALCPDRHNFRLVWRNSHTIHSTTMCDANKVAVTLVIAPQPYELVTSAADNCLAFTVHRQCVDVIGPGRRLGTIDDADCLAIICVPVCDLAVGAGRYQLALIRVVHNCLEECVCKQVDPALERPHVPDDAAAV
eukprot:355645-Chlamydomonas_euryale.AAC.17